MRSRALGRLLTSIVAIVLSGSSVARAAEVRVEAPQSCVEAASIDEQVDGILGQPVATVDGVDFEVKIAADAAGRWTLRLDTIDRTAGARRTRTLAASTCAELADAAAVAIAVSIKSASEARRTRPKADPPPASEPPVPVVERAIERPPASAPPEPRRRALALSLVADTGTMPRTAFGLALDGSFQLRAVRFVGQGALFLPQEMRRPSNVGGDFQLALAAGLACLGGELGRVTLMACAGGEAGRLSGSGVGVSSPRTVGTLWLAGRAEGSASLALGPRVALLARAGAAIPAFRPTFQLDATTVHQAKAVTGRATIGVEVTF